MPHLWKPTFVTHEGSIIFPPFATSLLAIIEPKISKNPSWPSPHDFSSHDRLTFIFTLNAGGITSVDIHPDRTRFATAGVGAHLLANFSAHAHFFV
jgi:hypothetical protein